MKNKIATIHNRTPKIINFAEIPADAYDKWEQFSEELLQEMGFDILLPPARGQDGGKDMVVAGRSIRYIVSCKHYANTGRAVGVNDEVSILERTKAANADGFIGIYSSVVSEGLLTRLDDLKCNGSLRDYRVL